MSAKPIAAATVLAAAVLLAAPAQAGLFKRNKPDTPPASAAKPAPKAGLDTAREAPRKATAEERAAAQRSEPLARMAFWSREFDLDAQDAEAGAALSAALRALGRFGEATEVAERALTLKPGHLDSLLELARAQIARNQGFYAIEPARKAQTAAPKDWRAPSLLGVAYEQVGRGTEARAAWEQALRLSPDNPAVLANMAMAMATTGDLPGAEALLRRAAAQKGAGVKVRQNLVLVLGLQGKMQEAERLAREDLPPEVASANLDWLRSASAGGHRSWDAMKDRTTATN